MSRPGSTAICTSKTPGTMQSTTAASPVSALKRGRVQARIPDFALDWQT
jgi:hypothetical protein